MRPASEDIHKESIGGGEEVNSSKVSVPKKAEPSIGELDRPSGNNKNSSNFPDLAIDHQAQDKVTKVDDVAGTKSAAQGSKPGISCESKPASSNAAGSDVPRQAQRLAVPSHTCYAATLVKIMSRISIFHPPAAEQIFSVESLSTRVRILDFMKNILSMPRRCPHECSSLITTSPL